MSKDHKAPGLLDPAILFPAMRDAVVKLDPRKLLRNPVIFVTEIVAIVVTILFIRDLAQDPGEAGFSGQIAAWLWFTVLFATFAEAVAEGRGRAQADSLKKTKSELVARRLGSNGKTETIPASSLKVGDVVLVAAGELIPGDGEVIEGVASVNESAITGESAPVIRESGGDRSAVTGGTRVLSDRIVIRVTSEPGQSFLDRMIALVEGGERQQTPNEKALGVLLISMTLVFLLVTFTLHGGQRFTIENCVICHHPNATDVARRPTDKLPAESIHFKYMIHRIHTGEDLEREYTAYGFGNVPHNSNKVLYPGDRRNCEACHKPGTYGLPVPSQSLPTVTARDWYTPMQPEAASCLSCHSSLHAAAHAWVNTAPFGEACASCHGDGRDYSVAKAHAR